jgi:hypothetical protein
LDDWQSSGGDRAGEALSDSSLTRLQQSWTPPPLPQICRFGELLVVGSRTNDSAAFSDATGAMELVGQETFTARHRIQEMGLL